MATCSVDECNGTVLARDLCDKHYRRWLVSTRSTCSVDECGGTIQAGGLCAKHYKRWRRHGSPLLTLVDRADHGAPQEFIEMALNHQDKEGCLFWPFGTGGYAYHKTGTGESQLVHRRICEKVHGPPPSTKHQACHNCGKGHLGCINPHHLRWDTPAGNAADKIIHGTDIRGERSGMAKLNWEKVREIRTMQETGLTQRDVAAIFGVSIITIYDIWNGRTWKEGVEHGGGELGRS